MVAQTKITGIKEVIETFSKLPKSVRNKAMRPALRVGATVIQKAAIANLLSVLSGSSTGLLQRNIRIYNLKKFRGKLRVAVMVKRGLVYPGRIVKGKPVRVGEAAAVLEYGKDDQPPRSWIRKAARESPPKVLSEMTQEARKRMESAINDAKK